MNGSWRAAIAFAACTAACGRGGPAPEVLGEINREVLTTDEFLHQLALRGGGSMEGRGRREFKRALLAELVDRKLLLQECRRRRIRPARPGFRNAMRALGADGATGWAMGDAALRWQVEDDAWDRAAVEELADRVAADADPPSRDDADRWLAAHPEAAVAQARMKLRQIVVRSAAMRDAVKRALAGGMPFERAARRWSAAPERREEGALGWRGRDEVPPAVWAAAEAAKPGRAAGPVDTPYGAVFVAVEGRDDGGRLPRSEARDRARRAIRAERRARALDGFLAGLRKAARISLDLRAVDAL